MISRACGNPDELDFFSQFTFIFQISSGFIISVKLACKNGQVLCSFICFCIAAVLCY